MTDTHILLHSNVNTLSLMVHINYKYNSQVRCMYVLCDHTQTTHHRELLQLQL